MASSAFYFFFLLYFHLPCNYADQNHQQQRCPTFTCGSFGQVGFPFVNTNNNPEHPYCGSSLILNCTDPVPKIQFSKQGGWYPVLNMSYSDKRIAIHDLYLQDHLDTSQCNTLEVTEPFTSSVHFSLVTPSFTFILCNRSKSHDSPQEQFFQSLQNFTSCFDDSVVYFTKGYNNTVPPLPDGLLNRCVIHKLPRSPYLQNSSNWEYSAHQAFNAVMLESRQIAYKTVWANVTVGNSSRTTPYVTPNSPGSNSGATPYVTANSTGSNSGATPYVTANSTGSNSGATPYVTANSTGSNSGATPYVTANSTGSNSGATPYVTANSTGSNSIGNGQNRSEASRNLTDLVTARYILRWEINEDCIHCQLEGGFCQEDENGNLQCRGLKGEGKGRRLVVIIVLTISTCAILLIVIILYCSLKKKCLKTNSVVFGKRRKNAQFFEDFLQNHASITPKRYSYSEIRKITNSFKDKLGEGGFGGVFKGKLPDGHFVAVKLLKESKGNGEDFVNEVASISKTSHVNIVSLLGFCSKGSKRALVYDFMPNGSLDKFIYNKSSTTISCSPLNLKMLYEIAIGIARGLEYLHRGCNTRIVHFDIKPNNILLDENFCPKISDFGLAKLCKRKDSIISMFGARGTIGYIAPELLYAHHRGVTGVSYKSDVYSYGMMVLEMVGGRHNTEVGVDRTSEIYFPYWIHQRLEQEEDLILHGIASEEEREIAKKMILVGLWCIQTYPSDRPSMNKVLEMLEGSIESLKNPPKPFLYPPERSPVDSFTN